MVGSGVDVKDESLGLWYGQKLSGVEVKYIFADPWAVVTAASLGASALENTKLVNYENRVIVTVVLIEILLYLCLYFVSTLDLKFCIYLA